MSNPCCVRGCENTKTHEHHIRRGGKDVFRNSFGKDLTHIVRICEPCRKALVGKPIRTTHWRCGSLAFVHELWEDFDETG